MRGATSAGQHIKPPFVWPDSLKGEQHTRLGREIVVSSLGRAHVFLDPWDGFAGVVDEEERSMPGEPRELAEHKLGALVSVEVKTDKGLQRIEHDDVRAMRGNLGVGVSGFGRQTFRADGFFNIGEAEGIGCSAPDGIGLDLIFLHRSVGPNEGHAVGASDLCSEERDACG